MTYYWRYGFPSRLQDYDCGPFRSSLSDGTLDCTYANYGSTAAHLNKEARSRACCEVAVTISLYG
jgi:hypothetical protein